MEKQEMQMIQGMFETLMVKIDSLENKFDGLENKVDGLEAKVDRLDEKVTRIDVTMENEIGPNIKLLAEGQEVINQKLDRLDDVPERLENLEIKVDAISPVVRNHSISLKRINK